MAIIMDFFQQYFIDPIINGSGYNIYNTIAYAIVLVFAAFITFKLIKKMKIKIDNDFAIGIIPYVVLGGLLRALEDAGTFNTFWLITPLIYVTIFIIAFIALFGSKLIEMKTKYKYHKIWFAIGMAVVLVFTAQLKITNVKGMALIIGITLMWAALLIILKKISSKTKASSFFSWENTALLGVHMFDATTTFVALSFFPYFEQHVLPSFLIELFGPAVMFVLKFAVISAALYLLDKEAKNEQNKFVKIIVLILGLAPGLRNALRLIMGV
jgi:uncharacterized membrane protein